MARDTWLEAQALSVLNDTSGRFDERDRADAEVYVDHFSRQWNGLGNGVADDAVARLTSRQGDVYQYIRDSQRETDANAEALESGAMSVEDFLTKNASITARRKELERMLVGLESNEAHIEAIREDPVGYWDALLEKWPTLHQQRPDIYAFLHNRKLDRASKEREKYRSKRQ